MSGRSTKPRWAIFVHDPDVDGSGIIVGPFHDEQRADAKAATIVKASGIYLDYVTLTIPLLPAATGLRAIVDAVR